MGTGIIFLFPFLPFSLSLYWVLQMYAHISFCGRTLSGICLHPATFSEDLLSLFILWVYIMDRGFLYLFLVGKSNRNALYANMFLFLILFFLLIWEFVIQNYSVSSLFKLLKHFMRHFHCKFVDMHSLSWYSRKECLYVFVLE